MEAWIVNGGHHSQQMLFLFVMGRTKHLSKQALLLSTSHEYHVFLWLKQSSPQCLSPAVHLPNTHTSRLRLSPRIYDHSNNWSPPNTWGIVLPYRCLPLNASTLTILARLPCYLKLRLFENRNYKLSLKKRFYLFIFREGGRREKERERNISVWVPLVHPLLGTWPSTQACALTGNQTGDPSVHRPTLNPQSYSSQGYKLPFT